MCNAWLVTKRKKHTQISKVSDHRALPWDLRKHGLSPGRLRQDASAGSGSVRLSGGTVAASNSCSIWLNVTGTAVGTSLP
jgi:hypothetical protein